MKHDFPVIAGMATIDGRQESMKDAVESLAGQVDEIYVYCNDYYAGIDFLMSISCKNNQLFVCDTHILGHMDHGDAAKFFNHSDGYDQPVYCLVVDDDLIYPPDFVDRLVACIKSHDYKVAAGCHGRIQRSPVESYYRGLRGHQAIRALDGVEEDTRVTILGAGGAMWHSSLIEFTMDDFPQSLPDGRPSRNMADIWFSRKLNEAEIPRIVVAHEAGWIEHTDKINLDTTIARTAPDDDSVQTDVFNEVRWQL